MLNPDTYLSSEHAVYEKAVLAAMKNNVKQLKETVIAADDPMRYEKTYLSNNNHLYSRLQVMATAAQDLPTLYSKNVHQLMSELSITLEEKEKESRVLSSARLRNLPVDVSTEQLLKTATVALQRKNYRYAVKNFYFVIDRLVMETPIYKMSITQKIQLAKLYGKRAECNLELAKSGRSLRYTDKTIDDCVFVLEIGIFNIDLIEQEVELSNKLRQLHAKAKQLKTELTRRPNNETASQRRRRLQRERERNEEEETRNVEIVFL